MPLDLVARCAFHRLSIVLSRSGRQKPVKPLALESEATITKSKKTHTKVIHQPQMHALFFTSPHVIELSFE
jgi:hypothetical protein